MKEITEYTKKDLTTFSKLIMLKGYSKLNKAELYEKIVMYFKENYVYIEEYLMNMDMSHRMAYCKKDSENDLTKNFTVNDFRTIEYDLISTITNRHYPIELIKELSFFISNCKYKICDDLNFSYLVLENDEYYGFISPEVDSDDNNEEDNEFELSLVNTIEEYENHIKK